MPFVKQKKRRNFTPPEIAERYGVATAKVISWIRQGELLAINVANRGCVRPRYSVSPDSLEQFEQSRAVIPDGGESTTTQLRRKASETKHFFK